MAARLGIFAPFRYPPHVVWVDAYVGAYATHRTTAERLQIQTIRILYGCQGVGDDGNPGLRFAYPRLYASPKSRPHMLRMSSHPQPR